MAFGDFDQRLRGTGWLAAPLLPILERAHRDAKQRGEGGLRQPGNEPGACDLRNISVSAPARNWSESDDLEAERKLGC